MVDLFDFHFLIENLSVVAQVLDLAVRIYWDHFRRHDLGTKIEILVNFFTIFFSKNFQVLKLFKNSQNLCSKSR